MNAKSKFKINIFDVLIAVLVIILAAGLYIATHKEKVVATKTLRYTIELANLPAGLTDKIQSGDKLSDGVKNYNMGKVVSVEKVENLKLTNNYNENKIVERATKNSEKAIIVVEANVTETESDYKADGMFLIKAGLNVDVHGPGYAGSGYIINVERGETK